jgi:glycosyltransferase involved in cell wall biosynthesis
MRFAIALSTSRWKPTSHLFVVGDGFGWSIDEDARFIACTARRLGYQVSPSRWARFARNQAVFFPNHFTGLDPLWTRSTHRLGLGYLHGRPGTPGYPEFDLAFDRLRSDPSRIARVHVTHREMRDLVVSAGVDPAHVSTIPLGVDRKRYRPATVESRQRARARFGIGADRFVVGSFQKDGVGLGTGSEPKLIKGPDVLLATLDAVHASIPEIHVLLTGLARGYVLEGLERLGIPYTYVLLPTADDVAFAYHALDAYLVTSRQEGGPKGPLEAMATGIPVVTTRVGQTQEITEHGRNALLADIDDTAALAAGLIHIAGDSELQAVLRREGQQTAAAYDEELLIADWEALLDGFVDQPAHP